MATGTDGLAAVAAALPLEGATNETGDRRPNKLRLDASDAAKPNGPGRTDAVLPYPIEMVSPSKLTPARRNARTHPKKQIRGIADSIARFGFNCAVVADSRGQIIAGHARVEAAKLLKLSRIPVVRLSHLNEMEIRAYMLADNKLASNAGWDRELLAVELAELQLSLSEINLNLGITGFEPGEIDGIISDFAEGTSNAADQLPDIQEEMISKTGDVYQLGRHRLLVGDACETNAFATLMQHERAEMIFTDPPYNVPIRGHVGGRGRIKHREFVKASGEMSSDQFTRFLQDELGLCAAYTVDGGITYVFIDWRHIRELLEAGAVVYGQPKNVCVWVKTNPGQGSFYRNQHELVVVYKRGDAPHINTFELGQHGRSRSNVWTYPGVNTFKTGRLSELKMHPTVKPVGLVVDAMKDCSRRGSIILDAFAGSGTTIIAAEQIGRRAFCMEIDPRYVDVAVRRWQRVTGRDAILEATKQTFDSLCAASCDANAQRRI
jgi:DNA modification methylase